MTTKTKTAEPMLFAAEAPKEEPKGKTAPVKVAKPKGKTKSTAVAVHKPQASVPPKPSPQPTSVLELCMLAARDPTIPPERLRAFLDMADQQERKEAETAFDHAMHAAQTAMPAIPRTSYNKHTKSWWARIEKVSAMIDPIAKEHGFILKYGVGEQRIEDHYHIFVDVTWTGNLSSGKRGSYTKRYDLDVGRDDKGPKGDGTKSLAQGSVSSMTYGRRILKCMVFDVLVLGLDRDGNPVGADDGDVERITEDQVKTLLEICRDKNIGLPMIQRVFKVDALEDIPASKFEETKDRLNRAAKQPAVKAETAE